MQMESSDQAELKWSGAGRAIVQVLAILPSIEFYFDVIFRRSLNITAVTVVKHHVLSTSASMLLFRAVEVM